MSYHVESDDRHPLISEGYHEHRTNVVRQQDAKKFDSSKALSNDAVSKLLATMVVTHLSGSRGTTT